MIERPRTRSDIVRHGEAQTNSKLTDAKVLEIIATIGAYPDALVSDLALKHLVSPACISKIKTDRAWMHLPRPWKFGAHRSRPGARKTASGNVSKENI